MARSKSSPRYSPLGKSLLPTFLPRAPFLRAQTKITRIPQLSRSSPCRLIRPSTRCIRRCLRSHSKSHRRQPTSSSGSRCYYRCDGWVRSFIWVAHNECARIIGLRGEARFGIEPRSDTSLRIMWQVRCEDVGRFLRRGGGNIRRIEVDSGARVGINRSDGCVEMHGGLNAIAQACDLVLAEVKQVSPARGNDGFMIEADNRSLFIDGCGSGGLSGAPMQLWAHSKKAGRVTGCGGEMVQDIMQRTGVHIQRSDSTEHCDAERLIQDVSYCRGASGVIKSFEMVSRRNRGGHSLRFAHVQ